MFKENFERICFEKKLPPSTVCQAIGLTRSTYSNWDESSVPRRKTLEKLSEYLQVSIDELLGNDRESHAPHAPDLTPGEMCLIAEYRANPSFAAIVDAAYSAIHPQQAEDVSS